MTGDGQGGDDQGLVTGDGQGEDDQGHPEGRTGGDEAETAHEQEEGDEWGTSDGSGPIAGIGGEGGPWTPAFLTDIRERRQRRVVALVAAGLVGVAAAWIHWIGLFVAGALVGLASRTVPRALLAAIAVGGLVLVAQVLASPVMDGGEFLALTPPAYVAIAAAVALPVWGSLIRGVV